MKKSSAPLVGQSRVQLGLFPMHIAVHPTALHSEHSLTAINCRFDNFTIVRCSWIDGDPPLERIKLAHALISAHAHYLVTSL
jgi:hypothetical protein